MKVKYKGPKLGGMNVLLPIGVKSRSAVRGNILLAPIAELSEEDAKKLVALDPHNFELVHGEESKEMEMPESEESMEAEAEMEADEKPSKAKVKKKK